MSTKHHTPMQWANHLLLKYWDGYLPVNVLDFANKLQITVISQPELFNAGREQVTVAIGFENDKPTIVYCTNNNFYTLRFAIAHAIGHYLLGHVKNNTDCSLLIDNNISIYGTFNSQQEQDAAAFAACLLMPTDVVHHTFRTGTDTMEAFSETFQMPLNGVSLRLKQLGYLPSFD